MSGSPSREDVTEHDSAPDEVHLAPPDRFDWRPVLGVALVGVALSVVMSWPLVLHLNHDVANDAGDPLIETWQVAWTGHALLHQPLHFFDSNAFWPEHHSLAFEDAMIGYAPTALVGSGTVVALIRYNLLYLFAYALAFLGA